MTGVAIKRTYILYSFYNENRRMYIGNVAFTSQNNYVAVVVVVVVVIVVVSYVTLQK